jgi:hypothetical protein
MVTTHFESQLLHQNSMEFILMILTVLLTFIITNEIIKGRISIKVIIITLGIVVGIIGMMSIINTFFREAPVISNEPF